MPFIKGRFHINPIAGQALEAAREAEAALLALEHAARQERQRQSNGGGDSSGAGDAEGGADADASNGNNSASDEGPIHRVEIEASEMVPSHRGHAVRGFVARVHRQPVAPGQPGSSARGYDNDEADSSQSGGGAFGARQSHAGSHGTSRGSSMAMSPETHVFADHRDLVSFLRDELAKDCK